MRFAVLALLLVLGSCTAAPVPTDTKTPDAAKSSKDVKPGDTATSSPEPVIPEPGSQGIELPGPELPDIVPQVNTLELMKQMFIVQNRLMQRILQLSTELTPQELKEFNDFLRPYGAQIKRKDPICPGPRHDPERVY